MPMTTQTDACAKPHTNHPDLSQEAKNQVNNILAQTDWSQYWPDVSERAKPEIDSYENACARSLASAARKFVH